ncbi:response regulator [Paenibacillus puldeungensis]|uniref:Response regulator n=1 Tax=Paenibacillus puldeungensis TaxID=696536 RepID=A0ABW3S4J6_9BACL
MKLLIIEDESRTRELLKKYVPWEEIGISQVECAKNGLSAMDVASALHPDIILCDVRMPKMNGIEFATAYRKQDSVSKIIFLSAYSDKEYLKSAIHLKAFSYIEKPINLDEVRKTVEEAVRLCEEEKKNFQAVGFLQQDLDRSLSILRQEMVRKLITNPSAGHALEALQKEDTFLLPIHGPYTAVAVSLFWIPPDHPDNPVTVQETILDMINRHSFFQTLKVLAGFDSKEFLVLLFPGYFGSSYRDGRETIERIQAEIKNIVSSTIEIRVGVGGTAQALLDIPEAYQQAVEASCLQFYGSGASPIFSDAPRVSVPLVTDWEEIRHLREDLRTGNIEKVKASIGRWTQHARSALDPDIVRVKDTFFQMLLAIMETAIQLNLAERSQSAERRYIWKEIDRLPSLDLLEEYLLSSVDSLDPESDSEETGKKKLREIIQYTHAHFHEKGFGIHAISEHVKLSETYLCSYFKKQCGRTIKEFITETRLQKAKELLCDPDMKLFEVASRLGFADANYFTTFFKRNTGMTPTEFREKVG